MQYGHFRQNVENVVNPFYIGSVDAGQKHFLTFQYMGNPSDTSVKKKLERVNERRPWTVAKEIPEIEWKDIGKEKAFQCPCCNKVFKTESRFNSHITQMKKTDPDHKQFFETAWDLIDLDESDSEEEIDPFRVNTKISENPGFGSVSIREQKKKKLPTERN